MVEDFISRANILMEALPYIKRYYGKTFVIKYGGNAMVSEELKKMITSDVVLMKYVGMNPIIVHGGGPQISEYMQKLSKEVQFVEGLRITDKETMEIVKMVLVGKINKELVALINRHGKLAVGVSGDDGNLIVAKKMKTDVDLGYVGQVDKINPEVVINLVNDGYIPVIATVGVDENGESYNINADEAAGEIAKALNANKIIFLTNVSGLYRDLSDEASLISELYVRDCYRVIERKIVSEGMIPKVKACCQAVESGVERAHILDGTIPHALLLEVFTDKGIGTMIVHD